MYVPKKQIVRACHGQQRSSELVLPKAHPGVCLEAEETPFYGQPNGSFSLQGVSENCCQIPAERIWGQGRSSLAGWGMCCQNRLGMVTFPLQGTGRGRTQRQQLSVGHVWKGDSRTLCYVVGLSFRPPHASRSCRTLSSLGGCLAPKKPFPKHQSTSQTVVNMQVMGSVAPQVLSCTHAQPPQPLSHPSL